MPYVPPSATNILAGLDMSPLDALKPEQSAIIAIVMARAAERSYRRGFQQGFVLSKARPDSIKPNLHDWRYGISTDVSCWADAPRVESALARLHIENGGLRQYLPETVEGYVSVEPSAAGEVLRRLVAEHRAALGPAFDVTRAAAMTTADAILGFGGELLAAGGVDLMAAAHESAVEQGGPHAAKWVDQIWMDIGAWVNLRTEEPK